MKRLTILFAVFLLAAGWTAWSGCSATSSDDDDGVGASGTGTGDAGWNPGENDSGLQDGEVCEGITEATDYIPLHMIIAADRSGSMDFYGYWQPVVNALVAFVQDPLSEGMFVGLNYFPAPNGGDNCNVGLWNPIQVPAGAPPLAELPAQANTLINSLQTVGTGNMTPMWGALEGSYQFAQTLQTAYPDDKVVVVLASDGEPTECGGNYEDINWIANNTVAPAYNNNDIQTYTIAIHTDVVGPMNIVAAAGGTGQTFDVSQNVNAFAQAMADIRGSALGCEFRIPDTSGGEFDPFQVNVILTLPGQDPVTIPKVENAAACGGGPGWYYDDPSNPTRIIFCQATCDQVMGHQETASVEVKFGCPSNTR